VPNGWLFSGLVYDVATGLVEVVVPPTPILGAAGGLMFEERFELLALPVGVDERVVDGLLAAIGLVIGPRAAVAAEFGLVAFDFDEEEAAWGGDEGIHFVDGAVIGDE
jgi:hypothetical protein